MNIHLKQRLVGALVLVALAAVFLPMVFEAPKKILLDRHSQVSQPPPFKKFQLVEPALRKPVAVQTTEKNDVLASAKPVEKVESAESSKSSKSKPKTTAKKNTTNQYENPSLDAQGLPVAWVIQVASFAKKENAEKLKSELRAKSYSAYTKSIDTPQGPAVRVFVGPKLEKKKAAAVKQRLDREFKLNTMIVRFEM